MLLWNITTRFLPFVKSEMEKGIQSLCYTSASLFKKNVWSLVSYYSIAFLILFYFIAIFSFFWGGVGGRGKALKIVTPEENCCIQTLCLKFLRGICEDFTLNGISLFGKS